MKRCSTSLSIGYAKWNQNEVSYTPTRMGKRKKEWMPNANKNVEKLDHSYIAGGRLNGTVTVEKHFGSFLEN